MTYMHDFRGELIKRLGTLEGALQEGEVEACDTAHAAFVKFICDKMLESYRNGQQAGATPERREGTPSRPAGFRARRRARA
jgi:hypothetical protein